MSAHPAQRPREIEELTNRFLIHPAGQFLLKPLASAGIHPNFVSFAGLFAGMGAAYFYYNYYQNPLAATLGFLLMLVWHITDGIDGRLARMTGKDSQLGKVIDGLVDYVVFILVYVFMSLAFAEKEGYWIAWYGPFAGLFHIIQAAAYEKRREDYIAWKYGSELNSSAVLKEEKSFKLSSLAVIFDWFYQQIQKAGGQSQTMQELKSRIDRLAPAKQQRIRREYCNRYAPLLRQWSLLSANTRTMAIYIACLAAGPLYYFLFEIILLNLVMLWLLIRQRRFDQRFCEWTLQRI